MRPTLFQFAAGDPAFLALARCHHRRCLADPELNHPFSNPDQHPKHIERLAAYWAEVLGGPPTFSDRYGSETAVLRMHAGNGDISDLGRRFLACFDGAMDDAGLPTDPAFRRAMHDYMAWAVGRVLAHEDRQGIRDGLGMPAWDWDGPVERPGRPAAP
jgi:hemoglobin